jgi:hypothetical protein
MSFMAPAFGLVSRIAQHNGKHCDKIGRNIQHIGENRRNQRHGNAAAHAAYQHSNCQNGVNKRAGYQLPKTLRQCLCSHQKGQQYGGFGDPANFFTQDDHLLSELVQRRKAVVTACTLVFYRLCRQKSSQKWQVDKKV